MLGARCEVSGDRKERFPFETGNSRVAPRDSPFEGGRGMSLQGKLWFKNVRQMPAMHYYDPKRETAFAGTQEAQHAG